MQTDRLRLKWDRTKLGEYSGKFVCAPYWLPLQHKYSPKIGSEISEIKSIEKIVRKVLKSLPVVDWSTSIIDMMQIQNLVFEYETILPAVQAKREYSMETFFWL